MPSPDWRDAAASAVDASVARQPTCPECGRMEALGHYALCSIGESVPAKPDPRHDEACERTWDARTYDYTPCGCRERRRRPA